MSNLKYNYHCYHILINDKEKLNCCWCDYTSTATIKRSIKFKEECPAIMRGTNTHGFYCPTYSHEQYSYRDGEIIKKKKLSNEDLLKIFNVKV